MRNFIVIYLLVLLAVSAAIGFLTLYGLIDFEIEIVELGVYCFSFGMMGGIVHCLRSIYLHRSLMGDWESKWNVWYFLRPIVSGITGVISMIFIKAGLLVFASGLQIDDRVMAYIAVAFLAGYNVKNFLSKIEDISKAVLGVEKKGFPEKEKEG
jgi:hypothetical protein